MFHVTTVSSRVMRECEHGTCPRSLARGRRAGVEAVELSTSLLGEQRLERLVRRLAVPRRAHDALLVDHEERRNGLDAVGVRGRAPVVGAHGPRDLLVV